VTYPRPPAQSPELFRLRTAATAPERSLRARQATMVLVPAGAPSDGSALANGTPSPQRLRLWSSNVPAHSRLGAGHSGNSGAYRTVAPQPSPPGAPAPSRNRVRTRSDGHPPWSMKALFSPLELTPTGRGQNALFDRLVTATDHYGPINTVSRVS
jgi:hypothetical protein